MNYLYDAIIESNKLEDERFNESIKKKDMKKSIKECIDKQEDIIEESCKEEKQDLQEAKMVDIEDYLEPKNYTEDLDSGEDKKTVVECNELPDRPQKGRPGSPEYDSNENRRKRVSRYRKNANLDESFKITKDTINEWALTKTCTQMNCPKERLRAELLGEAYTGLERYDED